MAIADRGTPLRSGRPLPEPAAIARFERPTARARLRRAAIRERRPRALPQIEARDARMSILRTKFTVRRSCFAAGPAHRAPRSPGARPPHAACSSMSCHKPSKPRTVPPPGDQMDWLGAEDGQSSLLARHRSGAERRCIEGTQAQSTSDYSVPRRHSDCCGDSCRNGCFVCLPTMMPFGGIRDRSWSARLTRKSLEACSLARTDPGEIARSRRVRSKPHTARAVAALKWRAEEGELACDL
jgi:hypothetical protein